MKSPKYVVLETLVGPSQGVRFFSVNSENNTHSANGELWYKEIAFCDTPEECQKHLNPIRTQDLLVAVGFYGK